MKKNLIVIFILFITLMSCKKDTISVAEPVSNTSTPTWADQYIGNYKGAWTSQSYGPPAPGPLYSKDTTIVIGAGSSDSSLTTSLSNCSVIYYDLSSDAFGIYHGKIFFRNDSMYYYCGNGGLGMGNNETFKGKKL